MTHILSGSRILRLIALVVILGLEIAVLGPASANRVGANDMAQLAGGTRTNEGGSVTVTLTWSGDGGDLAFLVVMDTHSVNLDQYDLAQLAVLRTGNGAELRPTAWNAPAGSHHREGTLIFAPLDADGSPIVSSATGSIEVTIRNVAGVSERVFRW